MKIRRQVYDLKPADLAQSSVWEFALDEEGEEDQDEATVRPFEIDGELDPSDGMFIVRANFTLADGSAMSGYLTPGVQGERGLDTIQPAVQTNDTDTTIEIVKSLDRIKSLLLDLKRELGT